MKPLQHSAQAPTTITPSNKSLGDLVKTTSDGKAAPLTNPYSQKQHSRWIAGSVGAKVSHFLFDSQQPNYSVQARLSKWKQVTSHTVVDPNQFTDPNMRWAALAARADRIMSDRRFQQLHTSKQQQILSAYYDKYVEPGYKSLGFKPPEKDLWLREIPNEQGKISSKAFFPGINSREQQLIAAGLGTGTGDIVHFMTHGGVWLSKEASYGLIGAAHLFHITSIPRYDKEKSTVEEYAKAQNEHLDALADSAFDQDRLYLQTHTSHSFMDHLDSGVGELYAQLPIWERVGAMRLGLGAKAAKFVPGASKIVNLSSKLMSTKEGAFVAHRLADASDGYIGNIVSGSNNKDSIINALGYMGFKGLLGVFGEEESKEPSKLLIKQLSAKTQAMGGKILQDVISDAADSELAKGILGYDKFGRPISIHPSSATEGHILVGDHKVSYHNADTQQFIIHNLIREGHEADPVRSSLVQAEKMTFSALARKQFPEKKYWHDLSQSQRRIIRQMKSALDGEALQEVKLHNPDLAKHEIDQKVAQSSAENPEYAQAKAQIEAMSGLKVTDVMYQTEQEAIEAKSGIKSPSATIQNIGKIKSKVKDKLLNETAKTTYEKTNELDNKRSEIGDKTELEPRRFAQMKLNTISYFKNIGSKYETAKETSAAIRDMNPEEFANELMEHIGNTFSFEGNVQHKLLWANAFRKELPRVYQNKLIKALHEIEPNGTLAIWDRKSKNLSMHMQELAYTGRLFSQGNIFRSTRVDRWLDKTKYQSDLLKEVEDKELAVLKMVMRRYPKAYKQAKDFTESIQSIRRAASNVDDYIKATDTIRGHKLKALKSYLGVE